MRQIHLEEPPTVGREGKWEWCENQQEQINESPHSWHQDVGTVGRALYFFILGQDEVLTMDKEAYKLILNYVQITRKKNILNGKYLS